jgi:hypothetical protein
METSKDDVDSKYDKLTMFNSANSSYHAAYVSQPMLFFTKGDGYSPFLVISSLTQM